MKRRQLLALGLVTGLLLAPLAASADSHEEGAKPLTWISYAMSQSGKGSELGMYIGEQGAKIYNPLMADGHILSWGVAMPINHRPGDDWNVMEYVTFRDWAAVDAFMGSFMSTQMSKSPEEQKAEMETWYSLIEAGSHYDTIYRQMIFEVGDMTPPAYFNLGYYDANPGQEEALMGQFEKYGKPVLGKLMEAGKVKSWGVAVPEVHGGTAGSHVMWWGMDSLAVRDAVVAGFEAAAKERGEEAQKAAMKEWMEAVDMSGHHDRIMMVVYKGGAAAPEGGEGEGGE